MKFVRTGTARSAMMVGIGTEFEGFERTQTMDPVDKVNMRSMIDTCTNDKQCYKMVESKLLMTETLVFRYNYCRIYMYRTDAI